MQEILEKVKLALRIVTDDFDDEILGLIEAAIKDLNIAGVSWAVLDDPLIVRAVTTYCKVNFGSPEEYDRMKASYDEQKAQLSMAIGYTNWGGDADGQICSD